MAQQHERPADWQAVLQNDDRDAFEALVEPYMDDLLRAAQHDLAYYVAQGHLHERDFTPEEIAGEALIHAWQHRRRRPEEMSLRGWLLGTQYRALRGLVKRQKDYRHDKALSLDAPVPPSGPEGEDAQEWFYEWYQPDNRFTWEEAIPGDQPVDIEVPLRGEKAKLLENENAYHVLMMHDEFKMPLPEVAFVMGRTTDELAEKLGQARVSLRERLAGDGPSAADDHPAPPEGSDM